MAGVGRAVSRLLFGGVRFELSGGADLAMDAEDADLAWPSETAAAFAQAHIEVEASAPDAATTDPGIAWSRSDAGITLRSRGLRAQLQRIAPGEYRGWAQLSATHRTRTTLLNAVACALAYAEGGLVLHAAALTDGADAIALIGPPGAGKTRACRLAEGMRWYALDRLVVVAHDSRTGVWPLAGGEAVPLSQHAGNPVPLRALAHVEESRGAAALRPASEGEAVLLLRESIHAPEQGEDEGELLARAHSLARALPIARLQTSFDGPLTALLRTL